MSDDPIFVVLRDIRNTQLEQAELNGRMAAQIDALSGPAGRVTKLEQSQARQWWLAVAITPFLAALHALARKFGVDV